MNVAGKPQENNDNKQKMRYAKIQYSHLHTIVCYNPGD
jgi:hypothetical protein